MAVDIQVGTILIAELPLLTRVLELESEPYSGAWSTVTDFNSFALDRKIHAAGWNFFFMAAEMKAVFFGAIGVGRIKQAIERILGKAQKQNFNSLEVTGIVARRFLGVPYTTISAHSRHIQKSCYLDSAEVRSAYQRDSEWARG